MVFTIEVAKAGDGYRARCPELEVETRGKTGEEAVERLKRIIDFTVQTATEDPEPPGRPRLFRRMRTGGESVWFH